MGTSRDMRYYERDLDYAYAWSLPLVRRDHAARRWMFLSRTLELFGILLR